MPRPKETLAPAAASTALAPTTANDNALALDELGGAELDADDGLGEVSGEDIRVATYTLNAKRIGANGRQIPADVYFDTLGEQVHEHVDAVFLSLHKTNLWSSYNQTENRTEVHCRSQDRKTGTLADGRTRPCLGCPDAEWKYDEAKGKRLRRCSPVYNVVSLDRGSQQLFVIRFKRTSLSIIKTHLQKHHIGRRVLRGRHVNYALYAFNVRLTGKMAGPNANHAVPIIDKQSVVTEAELRLYAETVAAINAQAASVIEQVDRSDADDSDGGDASFDPGRFAGDGGGKDDFVVSGEGGAT